jgi:hypothetical protein
MMNDQEKRYQGGLPLDKLAAPARRALANAGITSLDDLTKFTEKQISDLHGVGPNAMRDLQTALDTAGLKFAESAD